MLNNFYSPTPKGYRQLGDFCLIMIPAINGILIGAPHMSGDAKYWIGAITSTLLIAVKFWTNTFKEEEQTVEKK